MKDKIRETQSVAYVNTEHYSTLSSKGQVTIPAKIRDALNVEQGDQIKFSITEEKQVIVQAIKKDNLLSLFGSMPPKGDSKQRDWEEIRDTVRDEKGDHFKNGKGK